MAEVGAAADHHVKSIQACAPANFRTAEQCMCERLDDRRWAWTSGPNVYV
jgi:hypothetical protein